MSAKMEDTCEECGKTVIHEKGETGLEVIDMGKGRIKKVCTECSRKRRAESHAEDGGEA